MSCFVVVDKFIDDVFVVDSRLSSQLKIRNTDVVISTVQNDSGLHNTHTHTHTHCLKKDIYKFSGIGLFL